MPFKKNLLLSIIIMSFGLNSVFAQEIKKTETPKTSSKVITPCKTTQIKEKKPNYAKLYSEITLNLQENKMTLSLLDSLNIALKENFDIQSITAEKDRQKWLYRQQLSTFLPDITADYTYTKFNGNILVEYAFLLNEKGNSVDMGINGNWDVFTGFRRLYNTKEFKNLYKSAIKQKDRTVNQVLLDTTTQYYRLLQAKFNIKIYQTALASAQAQLKINQEQLAAGVGTKFDVLRAEAEVASFEQLLLETQNNYRLAQAQLSQTIGINVFTLVEPLDEEIQQKDLFKDTLNLNKLVEIALYNQPDIFIAQYDLNATKSRRNSAYSAYLPTISLRERGAEVGEDHSHLGHNRTRQIVATWTGGTGLGLYSFSEIKALNEEVKKSQINKIIVARDVQQKVLAAYNRVITTKEVVVAAQKEVQSADESLRLSLVRLKAGVGIYVDVLNAQDTQNRAMVKYLNALSDYNIFQAQLLYETGLISESNLIDGVTPAKLPTKEPKKK
ncbi:MAG: TolC family protein [bacterium]